MATTVLGPVTIPGLHAPPTREDLEKAALAYNLLPDDKDQPEISAAHLKEIMEMIVSHNVQEKFGIHLVHGHLHVDQGQVMHGTAMTRLRGCWTRPTDISGLDFGNMHGHIFALSSNGQFQAYEYRQGDPSPMSHNDNAFIVALEVYMQKHDLLSLIGLQVLNEDKDKQLQEFVLGDNNGTVMLDAKDTKIKESYRVTGFVVETNESGVIELKGKETHTPTIRQTHQVFTDGKPLPDEESLMDVLRANGVID
ncbi:hypothetical protein G6O67_007855 [Ophiocordyceps sinensis]|uniref:Uncharacterized protein n=2 Tax=Ophiocordyceps sinensis TaxID=72228 RepID=A0A8H4LS66_9HYPO|nr:hypothetical protein OCS_05063 [Ophiocordyceps sinensis CO18]KAF4504403.1 hypothetical protein G6O67_007855 [Ophiocordyceps sinensis]